MFNRRLIICLLKLDSQVIKAQNSHVIQEKEIYILTEPSDDINDRSCSEDDHGVTLVSSDQDITVVVEVHVKAA